MSLQAQADPSQNSKGKGGGDGSPNSYAQHNLVSSQAGVADLQDIEPVNAWGLAFNPNGPGWVADNGSGHSTIYDGSANKVGSITVPAVNGAGQGVPTGITFNSSNDFQITANTPARFVLATEDGGIFAWAPGLAVAVQMFPPANGATTAVYKGIALAGNGTGHQLYAADLSTRRSTCSMPASGRSRRRAASSTPASLRPAVLIRRRQRSLISQRALADGPDRPSATASTRARLSRNKRWQASVRRGDGPLALQTSDS